MTTTHPYGFLYNRGSFVKALISGTGNAMVADSLKRTYQATFPQTDSSQKNKMVKYAPGTKKTNIKKSAYKSKRSSTTQVVQKAILGMANTYHNTQNDSTLGGAMLHNNIYTNNLTAQISAGTGNTNRQGDGLFLKGIRVKGNFFTNATASAYQYRVMVVMSGEEYDFGVGFGTGLTTTELFLPTGTTIRTSSIVNPKAVTVLYDELIDINSQVAAARDIGSCQFYVPLNRKFVYQSAGSVYGKTKNIYLVTMGYVIGGTTGVTNVGDQSFNTDMVFKNL